MRGIDSYQKNILERTKNFAVSIIKFSSTLPRNAATFVLTDQLIGAATSIGANLIEAQEAVSGKDFLFKITISLKEAKETHYWLELISLSLINNDNTKDLLKECEEIVRILVAISRKLKIKAV